MRNGRPVQTPLLETCSPLAIATRSPCWGRNFTPVQFTASSAIKLCVDPESTRASSLVKPTQTRSFIVCVERGWIPVSAWSEIAGSSVSCCVVGSTRSSDSSGTISRKNNRLQRWSVTNFSSQLKQNLALRRSAIWAAVNCRLVKDGAAEMIGPSLGGLDTAGAITELDAELCT